MSHQNYGNAPPVPPRQYASPPQQHSGGQHYPPPQPAQLQHQYSHQQYPPPPNAAYPQPGLSQQPPNGYHPPPPPPRQYSSPGQYHPPQGSQQDVHNNMPHATHPAQGHYPPPPPPRPAPSHGGYQASTPAGPAGGNQQAPEAQSYYAGAASHAQDPGQDQVQNLAANVGNMSVNAQGPNTPQKPKITPAIRRTGPANDIILDCPCDGPLTFALTWYCLKGVSEFLVCTHCHADKIRGSILESQFVRIERPDGVSSTCRFWTPRVQNVVWPDALSSKDVTALKAYASKRLATVDCQAMQSADAIKWFHTKNNELTNFVSCAACYEDHIVGSSFEQKFDSTPVTNQSNETWTCDVAVEHIRNAIKAYSTKGRNDWSAFVAAATRRMALQPCTGDAVDADSCRWFTPKRHINDFVICETCYLDKLSLTEFEDEFATFQDAKPSTLGSLGAALISGQAPEPEQNMCDMAPISINIALDAAKGEHNFPTWLNAANAIRNYPPCPAEGTSGMTWYTLIGGCENFDVCHACYAGIVEPMGLRSFFQMRSPAEDEEIACDFNIVQPRFPIMLQKLAQVVLVGVFEPLESYIRKFANIPPCQGSKPLNNAVWYGYQDATICPECYEILVADSPLASTLTLRGGQAPIELMCCLYSPRMRQKWQEACAAKSPEEFVRFAKHRLSVYYATVPRVHAMEAMKVTKMAHALHTSALSLQYHGMAGISELAGTTDGYWHKYGNQLYTTSEGAYSAQLADEGRLEQRDALFGDDMMLKVQLMTQWAAVE